MSRIAELIAQKAALEKEIAEAQREAKAGAISQVKSLMAEHGLTVADLTAPTRSGPKPAGPRAGGKVAAKYRDENGNTWSGRGLKPTWLRDALAQGKALSDFAI